MQALGMKYAKPITEIDPFDYGQVIYSPERQIGLFKGEPLGIQAGGPTMYETREDTQRWTDKD